MSDINCLVDHGNLPCNCNIELDRMRAKIAVEASLSLCRNCAAKDARIAELEKENNHLHSEVKCKVEVIHGYLHDIDSMRSQLDRAREAVLKLEWTEQNDDGSLYCNFCGLDQTSRHHENCPYKKALSALGGE